MTLNGIVEFIAHTYGWTPDVILSQPYVYILDILDERASRLERNEKQREEQRDGVRHESDLSAMGIEMG